MAFARVCTSSSLKFLISSSCNNKLYGMNYKIKFEKRKFYKANSITLLNSYGLNLFTVLHVKKNEWSTDKI